MPHRTCMVLLHCHTFEKFSVRTYHSSMSMYDVNVSLLEKRLNDLSSLVKKIVVVKVEAAKAYGICKMIEHPTNMYLKIQKMIQRKEML